MISSEGTSPINVKIDEFFIKCQTAEKQVKRLIAVFHYFRAHLPILIERLIPSYKLLKYDNNCDLTVQHKNSMSESIKMLNNTCKKTLRLPKSDLQYNVNGHKLHLWGLRPYGRGLCVKPWGTRIEATCSCGFCLEDFPYNANKIIDLRKVVSRSSFCSGQFCVHLMGDWKSIFVIMLLMTKFE